MKPTAKIERLAAVPLFAGCRKADLAAIAEIADEITVDSGRRIITQGKHLRHAYIVVNGAASVTIDDEYVADLKEGEIIGEITMFDPAPALETVTATEPTSLIVVEHDRFIDIVRRNPDLAISLLKSLAHHFRETHSHHVTSARPRSEE